MPENSATNPQQLFKQWQNGDAAAGQAMARLVTDWYYALTAVRLGDRKGREPLEKACGAFASGITGVSRSGELVDWAHELIAKELKSAGGRGEPGDFPNALTGNRSPKELLNKAREAMNPEQVELLHAAFDGARPLNSLIDLAEARGGWPIAVLDARYALKRRLRENLGVNFSVVPQEPDLDRAPMPLYESARMASEAEEEAFEKWLLTDLDLCRDVAEFATFSHALRAGAFAPIARSQEAPRPPIRAELPAANRGDSPRVEAPPGRAKEAPAAPVGPAPQEKPPMGLVIGAVVAILAVLALIFYLVFVGA